MCNVAVTLELMMSELKGMTHSHFKSLLVESSVNKSALMKICSMDYRSQETVCKKIKGGFKENYMIK